MMTPCVVRQGVKMAEGNKVGCGDKDEATDTAAAALSHTPLSPGDFLRWLGQGAYTAVGVQWHQHLPVLPFWSQHLHRLENSVRTLSREQKWIQGDVCCSRLLRNITAKDLDQLIQPSVVEALRGVGEEAEQEKEEAKEVVMLTIAVKPNKERRAGRCGESLPLACYVLRCIVPLSDEPVSSLLKLVWQCTPNSVRLLKRRIIIIYSIQ
jgi:hypothetical protein